MRILCRRSNQDVTDSAKILEIKDASFSSRHLQVQGQVDCNLTARRPLDDLRLMTAASGLRHCELNDL